MTLYGVCKNIISLSDLINGERFTVRRLNAQLSAQFRGRTKIENKLVISIMLPDGEWLMTVNRFSTADDGFDYYIPETREQEDEIFRALTA